MQRLSKGFFLGSIIGAGAVSNLLLPFMANARQVETIVAITVFLIAATIYSMVIGAILWYRAWKAIQDGHARTTPGKAVGFMFIPIFSLYWVFYVIPGFATDYNKYLKRHNMGGYPLSRGFFLSATIIFLVTNLLVRIPFMPIVVMSSLTSFVIGIFLFNQVIDAVNMVVDVKHGGESSTEIPERKNIHVPGANIAIGVIAILFAFDVIIYAIAGRYIYEYKFLDCLMAVYHWGLVIFLGYLCKHPILKWFAMAAPAIALIVRIVSIIMRPHYF